VRIFGPDERTRIDWPDSADGQYACAYLSPLLAQGPGRYVANAHRTEVQVLRAGALTLPLTVSDFHPDNSYVCSPYSHYVAYGGYEEVERLNNPAAVWAVRKLLGPLAAWLRRHDLDRVVYANNWLLSTNLYPALDLGQVEKVATALPDQFPDRAVIFRSVDGYRNPGLLATLEACGYRMVLSRQVYYQDPVVACAKKQVKVDRSVLRRSPYRFVDARELGEAAIPRLVELYNLLYLQKYSTYNPQFTLEFVGHALAHHLLTVWALVDGTSLDGVVGYFTRNGVMTQPFFGYDTRLPQELGLYRLLSLKTLLEGESRGLLVHASAGVGPFKRLRGGVPTIEYNAVYDRHLPAARRRPWTLLKLLADRVAAPLFHHYGF
jgi:hypothetical protein